MRVIIGYGNALLGEDAFGIDVLKELKNFELQETKLLTAFGLVPELVLELLEANEVIFVDACYAASNHYALACDISIEQTPQFSHHIGPKVLMSMLQTLYDKTPRYRLYSMLCNSFEKIKNKNEYKKCVHTLALHLAAEEE